MKYISIVENLVNALNEIGVVVPIDTIDALIEIERDAICEAFKEGAITHLIDLDVDSIKHIDLNAYVYSVEHCDYKRM